MPFANPLMLTGLLAVSIPILIHLLNRRKAHDIDWGAMQFLLGSVVSRNRAPVLDIIAAHAACTTSRPRGSSKHAEQRNKSCPKATGTTPYCRSRFFLAPRIRQRYHRPQGEGGRGVENALSMGCRRPF